MNVMRTTVATVVAATLSMSAFSAFAAASLTGAGATFPAPVYAKWADTYQKETGNKVNYQGIGSSGGVKQIIANTVDFGASDAPLADDKLTQEGLFQFPTVIGGVVLAPVAWLVDPPLQGVTLTQAVGYLWLCVAGAMLAYGLWFRGISRLPSVAVSALSLLSPVTAVLLGWIFLGQKIEGGALVGLIVVLLSVLSIQRALTKKAP